MNNSPYLDRPLLPLAVALPRMLEKIGTPICTFSLQVAKKVTTGQVIAAAA
jgi:hypothetical protein